MSKLSKTPAPKSERIYGSKVNPKGTSATEKSAKSIKFDAKTLKSIYEKVREHNQSHPDKKVTISVAKAVVRRGMGAYSSTHRPTIKGGKPNSRVAWGLARLNAFLYKVVKGKSKSGKYSQDNDLLDELGVKHHKFEHGGEVQSFYSWFIKWYKHVSDKINIMISLPNEISGLKTIPYKEKNVVILDLFEKIDQSIDAKPYLREILDKADEYGVTIYLMPNPRYKYIKDPEHRKKITRDYLIRYYQNFGFEFTPDKEFMKRFPKNEKNTSFAKGGQVNECIEYIKSHESIFGNGFYFDMHELSILIDPYGQMPLHLDFTLVCYNSGGQRGLDAIDTINPTIVADELSKLCALEKSQSYIVVHYFIDNAKRLTDVEQINTEKIVIMDRDKIVCQNLNSYKVGGEVDDHKETYKKWRSLVNMSKSELKAFYDSEEGKEAGLSPSEAKEQGIDSGRESARWIMRMKDTPVADWTPTMWKWAKKQISFISRMRGNKGGLYDEKGRKTRKHTSLLIWGHNPEKYNMGGEITDACIEEVVNIFKSIQRIRDWFVTDGKLVIVFDDELMVHSVEKMNYNLEQFTECHDVLEPEVNLNYGEDYKSIYINLKKYNMTIGKYADGGEIGEIYVLENELKSGTKLLEAYMVVDKSNPFVLQFKDRAIYCLKFSKSKDGKWHFYNVAVGFTKKEFKEIQDRSLKPTIQNTSIIIGAEKKIIYELMKYEIDYLISKGYSISPLFVDEYGVTYSIEKIDDDFYTVNESFVKRGKQIENNNSLDTYANIGSNIFKAINGLYKKAIESNKMADGGMMDVRMEDTVQRMDDPNFADISYYKEGGQFKPHKSIEQIAKEKNVSLRYANEQLKKGIQVESEHSNSKQVQETIALQHLDEMIDYYEKLEKMEKSKETYKDGGSLKYDSPSVKEYFAHSSGSAGGVLVGKRHSEGGIKAINKSTGQPLEMEGGEVVITRNAVSDNTKREFEGEMLTNKEILSRINESGGGVKIFSEGGDIESDTCSCSGKSYKYGGKMMSDYEIAHDLSKYDSQNKIDTFSHKSDHNSLKNTFFPMQEIKTIQTNDVVVPQVETKDDKHEVILLKASELNYPEGLPILEVGSIIHSIDSKGNMDEWEIEYFTEDSVILKHKPKHKLHNNFENKIISYDELKDMYNDKHIQIDGIDNEKELGLVLEIIKEKINTITKFRDGGLVFTENEREDEQMIKQQFGNTKI